MRWPVIIGLVVLALLAGDKAFVAAIDAFMRHQNGEPRAARDASTFWALALGIASMGLSAVAGAIWAHG